ncbi:lasso peptide biosynthesis B2 protein [Caulobacter sp. X]|jgi:hypothetical protein|uniref:lasso peptide biosynthesis B2 protein n=2 Tax=Caulobacter TaxID=75 RepID=UPI000C149769|nr:lasso peptide biosynthesis B2 protein [Caulobacter sp. X]PIB96931.1 hypothetical protein CSW60_20830 [Caulobacter sp. X]
MGLRLADGVHAVLVGSDLVLFSPRDDAYFCLPLPEGALTLGQRSLRAELPGLGQALVESGLVEAAPEAAPVCGAELVVPSRTARRLVDEQIRSIDRRPRLRHWRALVLAILAARRGRSWSMARLVERHGPAPDRAPSLRLLSDLTVYRRLSPWLPVDGLCLFRSHMLLAYLNALGHGARWMFGVRTWPFRAHCWLQVGDVALDDEAERLCAYAPIMAV